MFHNSSLLKTFLMLMFLGFLQSKVEAQQIIAVQEGLEVSATLSTKALNRIAIENDRILSVKGTQGEFELDKDSELGQIFIKPKSVDRQEPIHLFLSTESGKTYALALVAQDIGAQSIVLRAPGFSQVAFEQAGAYEALIKNLIKAMHRQSEVEGFSSRIVNLKLPSIQGAKVMLLQSYSGHPLSAEVLELHNNTQQRLSLEEMDFYVDGVRAISLLHQTLEPNAKTRVYRVRS